MDALVKHLFRSVLANQIKGDDFVDRLHSFYSCTLFFLLAAAALVVKYVIQPINCWQPEELNTDSYIDTINEFCWNKEMDFPTNNMGQVVNHPDEPWLMNFGTGFYRWVGFIFIAQGFTFKIPSILWTLFSGTINSDLNKIRDMVEEARECKDERQSRRKMHQCVDYFETWVTGYKDYSNGTCGRHTPKFLPFFFCLGKSSGSYLSSLYLSIKLLNFSNVIFNFIVLLSVFSSEFWRYGYNFISDILVKGDFEDTGNFPRILMCEFEVRGAATSVYLPNLEIEPSLYMIPCEMAVNNLLEKVFILIWVWLVLLLFATGFNCILWLIKIKQPCATNLFTGDYIARIVMADDDARSIGTALTEPDEDDNEKQREFVEEYLRSDGVFMLRVLEMNADRSIVIDLVTYLWGRYKKIDRFRSSMLSLYDSETGVDQESLTKESNKHQNTGRPGNPGGQNKKLNPKSGLDNLGFVSENLGSNLMSAFGKFDDDDEDDTSGGLFGSMGGVFGGGDAVQSDDERPARKNSKPTGKGVAGLASLGGSLMAGDLIPDDIAGVFGGSEDDGESRQQKSRSKGSGRTDETGGMTGLGGLGGLLGDDDILSDSGNLNGLADSLLGVLKGSNTSSEPKRNKSTKSGSNKSAQGKNYPKSGKKSLDGDSKAIDKTSPETQDVERADPITASVSDNSQKSGDDILEISAVPKSSASSKISGVFGSIGSFKDKIKKSISRKFGKRAGSDSENLERLSFDKESPNDSQEDKEGTTGSNSGDGLENNNDRMPDTSNDSTDDNKIKQIIDKDDKIAELQTINEMADSITQEGRGGLSNVLGETGNKIDDDVGLTNHFMEAESTPKALSSDSNHGKKSVSDLFAKKASNRSNSQSPSEDMDKLSSSALGTAKSLDTVKDSISNQVKGIGDESSLAGPILSKAKGLGDLGSLAGPVLSKAKGLGEISKMSGFALDKAKDAVPGGLGNNVSSFIDRLDNNEEENGDVQLSDEAQEHIDEGEEDQVLEEEEIAEEGEEATEEVERESEA